MGKTYQIIKTLNNNCMILDVGGVEKLLLGKGIAFGKKNGNIVNFLLKSTKSSR